MAYRVFKSRKSRWAGHVARMEEARCGFKILTGKPTGKIPLGRPSCRWGDNVRMDFNSCQLKYGLMRLRKGII